MGGDAGQASAGRAGLPVQFMPDLPVFAQLPFTATRMLGSFKLPEITSTTDMVQGMLRMFR